MDRQDAEACRRLVEPVCEDLTVHTTLEEEIFYPAVREAIDDEDLMNEAAVEHETAQDADRAAREHGPGRPELLRHLHRARRVRHAPRQGRGKRDVPGRRKRPGARPARRSASDARPPRGDGRESAGVKPAPAQPMPGDEAGPEPPAPARTSARSATARARPPAASPAATAAAPARSSAASAAPDRPRDRERSRRLRWPRPRSRWHAAIARIGMQHGR